jgi:serine/threonine protein kinase
MSVTDPMIGRTLGDYAIQEMLGQGGMARVYKGYDEKLDRYAAVKVIDAHLVARETEDEYRERFRREARAIARLNHPNIVKIYQFGEDGSMYYMAMEYVSGKDLRQIIKEHTAKGDTMPYEQVMRLMYDITGALDYAHKEGVIHRDVKPSNIMMTPTGQSILMDFGLALSVPEGTLGSTFGSVHYIAPEQAVSSARAVPQSDMYSLGVVLFEMLTGRVPFDDQSTMSVALKHLSDPPPAPSSLNPNVLPQIEEVVLKSLDKEPRKRFPSGQDFARALEFAFGFNISLGFDEQWGSSGSRPSQLAMKPSSKPTRPASDDPLHHDITNRAKPGTGDMEDNPTITERTVTPSAQPTPNSNSQPIAPPKREPSKVSGLTVALITVFIVIIGLAVFAVVNNNNNVQLTPTALAVAEATETEEVTEAVVIPTNTVQPTTAPTEADTDTPEPENTPTQRPTNTPRPSPTPTESDTNTPEPTDTPEPTVVVVVPTDIPSPTPDNAAVILYYDHRTLALLNRSEESVDISDLYFVRTDEADQNYQFASNDWTNDSTLGNFRSLDCLQVWTSDFTFLEEDLSICRNRQGWRQLNTARLFWVSDEADATFEIRRGTSRVLATCPASPSSGTADFEYECTVDVSSGR